MLISVRTESIKIEKIHRMFLHDVMYTWSVVRIYGVIQVQLRLLFSMTQRGSRLLNGHKYITDCRKSLQAKLWERQQWSTTQDENLPSATAKALGVGPLGHKHTAPPA